MAFTNFCCRSGGSNLNAGTVDGGLTEPGVNPLVTYTGGDWNAATDVYTAPIGANMTEAQVGRYASLYHDGDTAPTTNQYLAGYISAVNAGAREITIHATRRALLGTEVANGTGSRSMRIGGAHAGPSGASGFPLPFIDDTLANVAGDLPRINMKSDVTYSVTASVSPTTAQNNVTIQGYTTSYGDEGTFTLDGGTSGASYQLFVPVTNSLHVLDAIFRNNGATGNAHGVAPSANCMFTRCVFHSFRGIGLFGSALATECEAYACNASNAGGWAGFYGVMSLVNCMSHDHVTANTSGFVAATGSIINCIADTCGQHGLQIGVNCQVIGLEAYNNGGDGMNISAGIVSGRNCNFSKNAGYGIRAYATAQGVLFNMGFGAGTHANTSGPTNTLGAIQLINSITYPTDAALYVDAPNGDFRHALAEMKGTGRGVYKQTAASYAGTIGYPDTGGPQHQDAGGGLMSSPRMTGGFHRSQSA